MGSHGGVVVVLLEAGHHLSAGAVPGPQARTYYIASDEVVAWNYAPTGTNMITGQWFDETANKYVRAGPNQLDIHEIPLPRLHRHYFHPPNLAAS